MRREERLKGLECKPSIKRVGCRGAWKEFARREDKMGLALVLMKRYGRRVRGALARRRGLRVREAIVVARGRRRHTRVSHLISCGGNILEHLTLSSSKFATTAILTIVFTTTTMSHHLFLLSPSDTPLYSLTHFSAKPSVSAPSPLSANLPSWSTSAFAGTLTALSGASTVTQTSAQGGGGRGWEADRTGM